VEGLRADSAIRAPVFFVMMKERVSRNGTLQPITQTDSRVPFGNSISTAVIKPTWAGPG
jgi:hypothetical protein